MDGAAASSRKESEALRQIRESSDSVPANLAEGFGQ
jgi:four helix bundle protein